VSFSLSLTTLLASGTFPKLRDRKETLQKSSQVFIEHALAVAWIQFQAQDESRLPWRVGRYEGIRPAKKYFIAVDC